MFEIYTFFGEAKEIEYGNKVKTQNDFDTMRRLRTMRLRRPSNHIFSNVQYDYDRNQNIVRQRNTVSQHNNLHLGGVSDKQYQYDKYNRLSRAIGTFTGFKEEQNYDLTMSYNATHGIVNKNQTHNVTLNQVPQNSVHNYQAEYFYDDDTHPHAPSLLQYQDGKSIKLSYDANGNLEHIQSDKDLVVVGNRDFEWDEQNRLLSVVDNGGQQISHYVYDHTGERTFKSEQGLSLANVSGQQAYEVSDMTNYTLYPSGFVTVNPERNEYTKHYYNNGKRLASRLMTLQGQFVSQNQLQPQAMSMQAMSATQSPQNCQQQLDAIMQYLANDPAMTDCLTAVQNINADPSYQNACDKLYAVNALNCSPADVIDVVITDPVYTPEEISELDCINAIYQLFYLSVYKSSSTYWLNADVKRCYSQIKGIIMKYFITPEPQRMDPCEFWEYLQQFLPCEPTPTIQEPVPTPTEPITYEPPVMTQPTPVHGFEPVQPSLDRVYYYHGDHLGSSTYVTDDNGRPVAYYDYLPFGETMVEHNQTTNFNNGYKFNAKELDEATGMSYYGARYYDPRISVFVSVDPLAEEFVGWTPYHYVHQNPINLIDPTGMSAEDGNGNPAKNIVINFLRNDRGSKNKPLGNFDNNDLAKNGWHVIDVSTIQEASDKLKKYLNGNKIDNLFINAHGNSITYSYEDGTFADFASGVKLGDIFISGRTLQLYSEGKFDELNDFHKGAVNAISALDDISKMMNTNSNLIFGSCFSGNEHRFGEFISQMNPQMNVFASGDGYYIEHNQKSKKTSFANFSNYAIRREDFEIGMRRYRSGRLIDEGFNIKINNKNGISIFK